MAVGEVEQPRERKGQENWPTSVEAAVRGRGHVVQELAAPREDRFCSLTLMRSS